MASKGDFLRRLNDAVTCPVCLVILEKPTSLHCGHTFCFACIQRLRGRDNHFYDFDDDSDDDMYLSRQLNTTVPCPICRQPFISHVDALPVNFTVQSIIAESLECNDGLCRACYRERKLEVATAKCRECNESLCETCGNEHPTDGHRLQSLVAEQCAKHQRNLELYCFPCRSKICVLCFSEAHKTHHCDAISQVAGKLVKTLKSDAEQLGSHRSRIHEVRSVLTARKLKYKDQLKDMKYNDRCVGQPSCAAKDEFEVGKDVHALVRTKLRSITDLMERSKKGKPLDREAARRLISDVGHLATAVIAQLEDGVIRSQKVLDDIDTLLRRANELSSGCESVYDLAASEQSVALLREEIESLLQDSSDEDDPYLLLAGAAEGRTLTSEDHKELEGLLEQAVELSQLLNNKPLPAVRRPNVIDKLLGRRRFREITPQLENVYTDPDSEAIRQRRPRPPVPLPKPKVGHHEALPPTLPKPTSNRDETLPSETLLPAEQQETRDAQQEQVPSPGGSPMSPVIKELQQRIAERTNL